MLSVLLRTWNVSCLIICYRSYGGLGGLVVLNFSIDIIEDLEDKLSYTLLSLFWRIWTVVVVYFVIDFIEDLEGYLSGTLLSML
jgi:hypothetical protein